MPDAPPIKRGMMYNTHMFQRCYAYHPCRRCQMCNHYNQHDPVCVACEGSKPPGMNSCHCSDDQQAAIVRFEEIIGRPWYSPNADQSEILFETAFNQGNTELVEEMSK